MAQVVTPVRMLTNLESNTHMDLFNIDQYKKHFKGFGVRDCVVRTKDVFYFVLFQDWDDSKPKPFDDELETRLVPLFLAKENKWSHSVLTGFGGLMAGAAQYPMSQGVMVDRHAQVFSFGGGLFEVENNIPGGGGMGPMRGGVRRIKQIDGWLYASGGLRSLCKRLGRNEWQEIGPLPPEGRGETGFDDFDAFSASDIYAAGGQGDVWHYDGQAWRRIPFPSNMWIESVCCGQDGYVYIGAQSGSVFRGRGEQWKLIHKGELSLPFKDMVWFGDCVHATNDYGLWLIRGEHVSESDAPVEITNCAGNLSVGDGVMLMAGAYGAALHDGTGWTRLFSLAQLAREARK